MPRQSSRRPAPSRPSRSVFGGNSSQSRPASTVAAAAPASYARPAAPSAPVASQPQQPGLFAQMASTAAGVAVGSAVGHTMGAGLTSLFSGSSDAPAEVQHVAAAQQAPAAQQACDADARNFTRCLEDSNGNYQACDFYLQQLKACQQAAAQY